MLRQGERILADAAVDHGAPAAADDRNYATIQGWPRVLSMRVALMLLT
jgi:hypothetical protein